MAGADVAVMDRNAESAREVATYINTHLEAAGKSGSARHFAVDVSSWDDVRGGVKQARDAFQGKSRLFASVNCAGITVDKMLAKMEEADWDKVLDVNLKGTFFVTRAVSQAIIEEQNGSVPTVMGGGGSIINVASIIGKQPAIGQGNYAASKAGVIAFSKTAAKELARNQIRVNSLLPGFIDTPMSRAVPQKVIDKLVPQIPLGSFGKPEHVADVALFLVSDMSAYVTGSAVEVTGGLYM